MGYFGGITWTMLVARVCKDLPMVSAMTIVENFFNFYATWAWPKPVVLASFNPTDYGFPVWNPNMNYQDSTHLMPVITPAYPQQNSSYNVTESAKKLIIRNFRDTSMALVDNGWDSLLLEFKFFKQYNHYLVVSAVAPDIEDHSKWSKFVLSKIRYLINNLDCCPYIKLAHVNAAEYTGDSICQSEIEIASKWCIGLKMNAKCGANVDLSEAVLKFQYSILKHAKNINLLSNGMAVIVEYCSKTNLTQHFQKNVLE